MTVSGTFPTFVMLHADSSQSISRMKSISAVQISLKACRTCMRLDAGVQKKENIQIHKKYDGIS